MRHMLFFSPPNQHDDPRHRIAKNTPHRRQWTYPSKPICVLQPSPFSHRQIMPSFSLYSKLSKPSPAGLSVAMHPILYPHDFLKTLLKKAAAF